MATDEYEPERDNPSLASEIDMAVCRQNADHEGDLPEFSVGVIQPPLCL